jgi:hypothetical protein
MTPGLIDMHQHVMLNPPEGTAAYQTRWDDAAGGAFALHHLNHNMLMKGITTVRDIAGDPLDVAKATRLPDFRRDRQAHEADAGRGKGDRLKLSVLREHQYVRFLRDHAGILHARAEDEGCRRRQGCP